LRRSAERGTDYNLGEKKQKYLAKGGRWGERGTRKEKFEFRGGEGIKELEGGTLGKGKNMQWMKRGLPYIISPFR